MPQTDQFGYDLTIASPAAARAWDATVHAFLSHGSSTPLHLQTALESDPEFGLGHAARGLFCLLLGRRELVPTATECLEMARTSERRLGATRRERAVTDALADWLCGWPSRAADRLDGTLAEYPRDTFLMKLVHAIRFVLGDAQGMRRSIETVADAHDASHPARGYLLGCHAFALEETGDYGLAETLGRQAVELAPDDAWGLHAVAHVHDMTGRADDGIKWLMARPDSWSHCNNFGFHVWWHLALMHLDRGETDLVLNLYDEEIRRDKTDDYRDISNATSLLLRLELEGVNVGSRWEELAQLSDRRTDDGCNVFADLHYLLALLKGGRRLGTERLLTSLARRRPEDGDMGRVSAHPGRAAAQGLEQFRLGNYCSAFQLLSRARGDMPAIGGSHAQRDVFERMTIDAALRAGLPDQAEGLLLDRSRQRGGLDNYARTRHATVDRMRKAAEIMQNHELRATRA